MKFVRIRTFSPPSQATVLASLVIVILVIAIRWYATGGLSPEERAALYAAHKRLQEAERAASRVARDPSFTGVPMQGQPYQPPSPPGGSQPSPVFNGSAEGDHWTRGNPPGATNNTGLPLGVLKDDLRDLFTFNLHWVTKVLKDTVGKKKAKELDLVYKKIRVEPNNIQFLPPGLYMRGHKEGHCDCKEGAASSWLQWGHAPSPTSSPWCQCCYPFALYDVPFKRDACVQLTFTLVKNHWPVVNVSLTDGGRQYFQASSLASDNETLCGRPNSHGHSFCVYFREVAVGTVSESRGVAGGLRLKGCPAFGYSINSELIVLEYTMGCYEITLKN